MLQIGGALKKARLTSGLSQLALAKRSKVSLATIQNLEGGRGNPEWSTIEAICQAMGLELDLRHRHFQLETLIPFGLPLLTRDSKNDVRPHIHALLERLNDLALAVDFQDFRCREAQCLQAFLIAIKDHYPRLWSQTPQKLERWLKTQRLDGAVIKLRRIALDTLGDYL